MFSHEGSKNMLIKLKSHYCTSPGVLLSLGDTPLIAPKAPAPLSLAQVKGKRKGVRNSTHLQHRVLGEPAAPQDRLGALALGMNFTRCCRRAAGAPS